eukprot:7135179-Prymnesium_polylepis.2
MLDWLANGGPFPKDLCVGLAGQHSRTNFEECRLLLLHQQQPGDQRAHILVGKVCVTRNHIKDVAPLMP